VSKIIAHDRKLTAIIDEGHAGQRLDHALAALSGLSRNHIQQLIRTRNVYAVGHHHETTTTPRASRKVECGQKFILVLPEPEPLGLTPEPVPLDILFEDENLLIVNKPAGMVVHPGRGHARGTLVHALLHHCPNLPGINGVERPGIVHRLDRDTSGSLVIAKTEQAHRLLAAMFSRHDIQRQYLAWCRGIPAWREHRIEKPVGRHPQHRQKMSVRSDGRTAVTEAMVERRYGSDFCRMRLTLHTGRTHQIRVHLSHLHLPILGDFTYARRYHPSRKVPDPARDVIERLDRQALHAEVLGFIHPVTGKPLKCIAPLPADLRLLSGALEESYGGKTGSD